MREQEPRAPPACFICGGPVAFDRRGPAGDIEVALLGIDPATGIELWKRPFGFIAAENNPSSIDLVVAVKGRVYVGAGRRLRAIDPLTGNDIWFATEPTGKGP
jgi:outer membrane protein assembly factor BamB